MREAWGGGVQPEKLLFGGDSAYRGTSFRYILDADKGSDFSGTLSYRCPRAFFLNLWVIDSPMTQRFLSGGFTGFG